MTRCTRFEDEALPILEQGGELDEHFSTCQTCIDECAKYEKLKRLIGDLDRDKPIDDDWMQPVLDAAAPTHASKPGNSWRWLGSMAAGIALVSIAVSYLVLRQSDTVDPLTVALSSGGAVYRGVEAVPGDQLSITGQVEHFAFAELRVYRDGDRLVLACSDSPPCRRDNGRLVADLELRALGEYQVVLLRGSTAPPPATDSLDTDVLAARERGATAMFAAAISVR